MFFSRSACQIENHRSLRKERERETCGVPGLPRLVPEGIHGDDTAQRAPDEG